MADGLMRWLGKQAALKAAESFIVPPRKTTPRTRTFKVGKGQEDAPGDEDPLPSQAPHRYGVPVKGASRRG